MCRLAIKIVQWTKLCQFGLLFFPIMLVLEKLPIFSKNYASIICQALIGIESDQLSQHYDDHLGLQTTGRRAFPASAR